MRHCQNGKPYNLTDDMLDLIKVKRKTHGNIKHKEIHLKQCKEKTGKLKMSDY